MDTHIHHLHTFLHTGSGLYNPLQQPHCVPRPHILYNISTTLYNTLQSTALQQFYSLQPLHHPSGHYKVYNMSWGKGEARGVPPLMPDTLIHAWGKATFEPPKWLFPTMFTPTLTQPNPSGDARGCRRHHPRQHACSGRP